MAFIRTLILFAILLPIWSFHPANDPGQVYIERFKDLAISEMHRSGIPASIKLAQALVETNSGRSILAKRAKNHFGLKCKSYWAGPRYFYTDDDRDAYGNLVPSCFRMYQSDEESFSDHTDFLVNSDRYEKLFQDPKASYRDWAIGLKECGYATDQAYGERLIRMIEEYKLDALDVHK